jgi:DNA (cytosine-5)-methyltransferase 1
MKVVSLFAGAGGFDIGFERAGFQIVAHVEKDAQCRKLLAARWPDAIALDDVCTAGANNLPACDVITYGFPCQDLSVAGKRAGLAGGRSGLFYEATRIINELRPTYCLFENVPGLLSSDGGRDFARVLMEMDRIGYCGAWRVFDAQYLGVAQRRRRCFGLFARVDIGAKRCAEVLLKSEGVPGDIAQSRKAGQGLTHSDAPSRTSSGRGVERAGESRGQDPVVAVPATGATLRAYSGRNQIESDYIPAVANCLQERDAKGADSDTKPGYLIPVACLMDQGGGRMEVQRDIAGTLRREAHGNNPAVNHGMSVRRLTPTECERLQGFPSDWTAGFSDSVRYRMLGNAVTVNVAEWIARRLVKHVQAAPMLLTKSRPSCYSRNVARDGDRR